jgi:uncharacterized membrane protein YidH (DUF202 family)
MMIKFINNIFITYMTSYDIHKIDNELHHIYHPNSQTKLAMDRTVLSEDRTRIAMDDFNLSNLNTFLAYMRTGLAIAVIAFTFNKFWICILGLLLIVYGTFEFYYTDYMVTNNLPLTSKYFYYGPVALTILIILVFIIETEELKHYKFKF